MNILRNKKDQLIHVTNEKPSKDWEVVIENVPQEFVDKFISMSTKRQNAFLDMYLLIPKVAKKTVKKAKK